MDIVIQTYFGAGSGVSDDLIGKIESTSVLAPHDCMLAIGEILCAIGQGLDVRVHYIATEGDE